MTNELSKLKEIAQKYNGFHDAEILPIQFDVAEEPVVLRLGFLRVMDVDDGWCRETSDSVTIAFHGALIEELLSKKLVGYSVIVMEIEANRVEIVSALADLGIRYSRITVITSEKNRNGMPMRCC